MENLAKTRTLSVIGFKSQVNGEAFYFDSFFNQFVSENKIDVSDEHGLTQRFGLATMSEATELFEKEGNVGELKDMEINLLSYDVVFNDENNSDSMGFVESQKYCFDYIDAKKGSRFAEYNGGTVKVVCRETEDVILELEVK